MSGEAAGRIRGRARIPMNAARGVGDPGKPSRLKGASSRHTDANGSRGAAEARDYGREKIRDFARQPPAITAAQGAIKRRSVGTAVGSDMNYVMLALAVARQLELDAAERIGFV